MRNQYHLEKQRILQFRGSGYKGINWVDSKKGRAPTARPIAAEVHSPTSSTQLTTNHSLSVHNITIHFRQSIIIIIIIIIITNNGESACVEPLCHQPGATGGGAHRRNKGIEGYKKGQSTAKSRCLLHMNGRRRRYCLQIL